MSLTCFIDNFDLYRNIYYSLIDIYFISTNLNLQDCQQTRNIYSITLSLHNFDLNNVVHLLEKDFRSLEANCILCINNIETNI